MRTKLATPVLIACALFMAMTAGTGLFEHLFGIPKMLSSPSAMAFVLESNARQPVIFWIPLHAAAFSTLILSLVFNWRNPARKKWILITFVLYVYISLVSIWFATQLMAFRELTDAAEFSRRTQQWITLSWHRPIIGVISAVILLIAISKAELENKSVA